MKYFISSVKHLHTCCCWISSYYKAGNHLGLPEPCKACNWSRGLLEPLQLQGFFGCGNDQTTSFCWQGQQFSLHRADPLHCLPFLYAWLTHNIQPVSLFIMSTLCSRPRHSSPTSSQAVIYLCHLTCVLLWHGFWIGLFFPKLITDLHLKSPAAQVHLQCNTSL